MMSVWWFYIFHAEPAKSAEFFTITYHAGAGGVVSYATTGERRGKVNGKVNRRSTPEGAKVKSENGNLRVSESRENLFTLPSGSRIKTAKRD